MKLKDIVITKNIISRFESKIILPFSYDDCWEFNSYNDRGYKTFTPVNGFKIPAHRFSYYVYISKFNENLLVCHKYDNRGCVNPYHLFIGTYADNNHDRDKKNRTAVGTMQPNSVLTENIVYNFLLFNIYKHIINKIKI